jgi:hypothetical protein
MPTLPTSRDSLLNGLKSSRGCAFAQDVDGDGKPEIAATSYSAQGGVAVFEAAGNDSMRLVWTSPRVASGGGSSTPRYVLFGDLDNDTKKEIIFQSNNNGIFVFEWDGVVGSDNYGTLPSQLLGQGPGYLTGVSGNCEYMEIGDVDGDAQQELIVAYNSTPSANDKFYVIRAIGDWSTNDPGFSSFEIEFSYAATDPGASAYGLSTGSPGAMITANLDGTGNKEIVIHNYAQKNIVAPLRVTGANTYSMPDSTTGRENIFLTPGVDQAAFFGGLAYDINADGREEVYLPTFAFDGSDPAGKVHMISYDVGQSLATIDSTNVTTLSVAGFAATTFGYGYGDMNLNSKKEIYLSSTLSYPGLTANNVVALEFQGGDKKNPANWVPRIVYRGDTTIYTALTYRDSLGRRDTIRVVDPSFASKIYGRNTDFDGDGREDIILPYQALSDSMSIRTLVWNAGAGRFDTTSNIRVANPKRWSLRVVERDPSVGVEAKDLTIITPDDYKLDQNYPNPFNTATTISFTLPIKDRISLKVYDLLGREVRTLINNEEYDRGVSRIVWDGKDNAGKQAATGVYFYTLRFGNFEKTHKMTLLK